MAQVDCRHFSGYKPCPRSEICDRLTCSSYSAVSERILIVHLGALGAVLRSTSLLKAIHRRYPNCHVTWVTKAPAEKLLENIADIDQVLTTSSEDLVSLKARKFDVAFVVDKSVVAAGILASTQVDKAYGFTTNGLGAILPLNTEATELWQLGLSNEMKFLKNRKTEQQLVHEALALGAFTRDEYQITLSNAEHEAVERRRKVWSPSGLPILGINTGCSGVLPAKKLSVAGHLRLIEEIRRNEVLKKMPIVLMGGNEDTERNSEIAFESGAMVIESSTTAGIRDGIVSIAAADIIFSGDSLGMHMAIGMKKWVVAWFGPTCAVEIDLYERGRKILTQASCSPCWKKDCGRSPMCYDQLDWQAIVKAMAEGVDWQTSLYRPHTLETSYLASP